jgi:hypothetical protein
MNKNALDAGISVRRMENGMDGKVINAKRVGMYFRTCGGNGILTSFGMNTVTNERRIVFSQKRQTEARNGSK